MPDSGFSPVRLEVSSCLTRSLPLPRLIRATHLSSWAQCPSTSRRELTHRPFARLPVLRSGNLKCYYGLIRQSLQLRSTWPNQLTWNGLAPRGHPRGSESPSLLCLDSPSRRAAIPTPLRSGGSQEVPVSQSIAFGQSLPPRLRRTVHSNRVPVGFYFGAAMFVSCYGPPLCSGARPDHALPPFRG